MSGSTKKNDNIHLKNFLHTQKPHLDSVNSICLLSPSYSQFNIFKQCFSDSRITVMDIRSWNLNKNKGYHFDLIYAGNVFHYSDSPDLWFENVLSCAGAFIIQDLINRKRGNSSELGSDSDRIRYSYSPEYISKFEKSYDLASFGDKVIAFNQYNNSNGSSHFVSLIRGRSNAKGNNKIELISRIRDSIFKIKYFIKGS